MLFSSCKYRKGEIKGNEPNMKGSGECMQDDNGDVMVLWIANDSFILNKKKERWESFKISTGVRNFYTRRQKAPAKKYMKKQQQ